MHPENTKAGKVFGARHRFKLYTGARYLSGCIGDDEYKPYCLGYRTVAWEQNIFTISETVVKRSQESYTAVVCVILSEWILLQWVTMDTGDAFAGV